MLGKGDGSLNLFIGVPRSGHQPILAAGACSAKQLPSSAGRRRRIEAVGALLPPGDYVPFYAQTPVRRVTPGKPGDYYAASPRQAFEAVQQVAKVAPDNPG